MASGAGGDREKRTLGQGRSAARRGGPYVAADEMRPVRRGEGDRDEQRDERYRRRQLDDPRGAGEGDHKVGQLGFRLSAPLLNAVIPLLHLQPLERAPADVG